MLDRETEEEEGRKVVYVMLVEATGRQPETQRRRRMKRKR